uniref:Uncharacterized protein n=1 Tax=Vespula pensylvanica TaxID=30213 RepID=A0A834U9T6_VESPE|nr:hypothetical protein H0235_009128 [Vespula pensylvanica]
MVACRGSHGETSELGWATRIIEQFGVLPKVASCATTGGDGPFRSLAASRRVSQPTGQTNSCTSLSTRDLLFESEEGRKMNEDFVGEPVLPTAALLRFFLRDDRRHPMYQVSGYIINRQLALWVDKLCASLRTSSSWEFDSSRQTGLEMFR